MSKLYLKFIVGCILAVIIQGAAAVESIQKVFLITSSTGALGTEIAEGLAKEGYHLILMGRNTEKLSKLKESLLAKYKIQVDVLKYDFTDQASIGKAADKLSQKLDGMVIIPPRNIFSTKGVPEAKEWRSAIEEGFIGPVEFIRSFSNKLNENSSTVIISGITSKHYLSEYPNSNVIKLMWSGEVKNLCSQFSDKHHRFNIVSPNTILTAFNIQKVQKRAVDAGTSYDEQIAAETKSLPSKRYGKPTDVANLVAFLLSDKSEYMNCDNILLDGGASKSY